MNILVEDISMKHSTSVKQPEAGYQVTLHAVSGRKLYDANNC